MIQTTASQGPNVYSGGSAGTTAEQMSTVTTTEDEQDKEITQSRTGQPSNMTTDMDSDLTSAPLKEAPLLDYSTLENDKVESL